MKNFLMILKAMITDFIFMGHENNYLANLDRFNAVKGADVSGVTFKPLRGD